MNFIHERLKVSGDSHAFGCRKPYRRETLAWPFENSLENPIAKSSVRIFNHASFKALGAGGAGARWRAHVHAGFSVSVAGGYMW